MYNEVQNSVQWNSDQTPSSFVEFDPSSELRWCNRSLRFEDKQGSRILSLLLFRHNGCVALPSGSQSMITFAGLTWLFGKPTCLSGQTEVCDKQVFQKLSCHQDKQNREMFYLIKSPHAVTTHDAIDGL